MMKSLLPSVVTILLLGMIPLHRSWLGTPPDEAIPYLARCRDAAGEIPLSIRGWVGRDAPVPTQATDILRPNVLVSRSYERLSDGMSISLLIVQTQDALRLLGHYPPACYPGSGWVMESSAQQDWEFENSTYAGMRYVFSRSDRGREHKIVVNNFMLRPDGRTGRDMEAITAAGRTGRARHYGAGQFQLITPVDLDAAAQEEIMRTFVLASKPTLDTILAGFEPL